MPLQDGSIGVTGADTIRALRKLGSTALVVGFSANDVGAEHVAAGADLFWRKPGPEPTVMAAVLSESLGLPRGPWRVLAVDDDPTVRFVLVRKLKQALPDCRVVEADFVRVGSPSSISCLSLCLIAGGIPITLAPWAVAETAAALNGL